MPLLKSSVKARIRDFDWILLLLIILLLIYGIAVIYSTATAHIFTGITKNQIIFASVGLFLFLFFSLFNYRIFKNWSLYLYLLGIFSLGVVLITGKVTHGSVRWLNIGFFQLQPSEFFKIILIIVLAKFFSSHSDEEGLKVFLLSLIYTLIPVILVLMQPDLGTALVFLVIWGGIYLASHFPKKYLFILLGIGILSFPFLWNFLHDYQKKRILVFLNPTSDPLGAGYNVLQSIIATGSGKFWGRGLGYGYQSQLKFLPIQHTDFIFAVFAESLGFLGVLALLILFLLLLLRILKIALRAGDNFGLLAGIGIFSMFIFQIAVNIGMNVGTFPVTGVPLPLISAGGSSLITFLISLGILESIALQRRKIVF